MGGADPHAAIYDRWAAGFEERNAAMPDPLVALGEGLLAVLPDRSRILDVGCGPGRDMAWFEARGAFVTGIDVSPAMLALAARRTRGELVEMDMRRIAFDDASFDAVWAIASLLHVPKGEAGGVVAEFRRIVRSEGAVAISVKRGSGERWEASGSGPRRFFASYEPAELAGLLRAVGLVPDSVAIVPGRGCEWLNVLARPTG